MCKRVKLPPQKKQRKATVKILCPFCNTAENLHYYKLYCRTCLPKRLPEAAKKPRVATYPKFKFRIPHFYFKKAQPLPLEKGKCNKFKLFECNLFRCKARQC